MIIEGSHDSMTHNDIGFLLDYCSKHSETFNKIANHLWQRFNIKSAELVLLITYYVVEERKSFNNGKNDN